MARFNGVRFAAAVAFGCLAVSVFADGKVFQVAAPPAEIPGQSALIHYAAGVETLAIETRFVGKGTSFGWIVPLPATPEVFPATPGLFPTLRATAVPAVAQPTNLLWLFIAFVLATAVFVQMKPRVVAVPLSALILVLGGGLCMPSLGRSRGGGERGPGVVEIDRRTVGEFEVVTLGAGDAAPLLEWLGREDFVIPAEGAAAIRDYVRDGWVFAACKLRRDADTGAVAATHPLVFRFKTPVAVYPMRLTGAGAKEAAKIELYVFGDRAARCRGMEVERCLPTTGWNQTGPMQGVRHCMPVAHPTLAALVGPAPVMTKLAGTFAPSAMDLDLTMEWTDSGAVSDVAYSNDGAWLLGLQMGMGIAVAVSLGAGVLASMGRWSDARAKRVAALSLVGGVCVGVAVYAVLPKTPVESGHALRSHEYLVQRVAIDAGGECERKGATTFADFRAAFDERMRVLRDLGNGPVPREEDSPGNYTLREGEGSAWVVVCDRTGQEREVYAHRLGDAAPAR